MICRALDPEVPASLSRTIVDGWLRRALSYDGVIVSDDLEMRAIADHFGLGDAAVRAIQAGSDIVLVCKTPEWVRESHAASRDALASGAIPASEEAASERRRQRMTARAHKIAAAAARADADARAARAKAGANGKDGDEIIGAHAHRALASRCT